MEDLLESVPKGATVRDFFMGAVSAGVAAVRTGRRLIGQKRCWNIDALKALGRKERTKIGKKRYKSVRAGRIVSEILYEQATRADGDAARQSKLEYSSMARQKLNNDSSAHRLEMRLAGSFSEDDYWITLTYDDDHLPRGPDDRRIAKARAAQFFDALRASRKLAKQTLVYAYCTESVTEGVPRLHHHCIINASGRTRDRDVWRKIWAHDLEQMKSLWRQGDAHVETFRMAERRHGERTAARAVPKTSFDDSHLVFRSRNIWENIAGYMMKERRERDAKPLGERAWNCSRNMRKPLVVSEWADAMAPLSIPLDAIPLVHESKSNGYGSYQWVKYILPEGCTE